MAQARKAPAKKDKEAVRKEFEKLFEEFGVGERSITFTLLGNKRHQMLKPKAKITKNGYVFNLRYVKESETPFIDEQYELGIDEQSYSLDAINIAPRQVVASPGDPCLQKFLLLHPWSEMNGGDCFTIYRPEQVAKDKFDKRAERYLAEKAIMESDENTLTDVGIVLTKDFSGSFERLTIEDRRNSLFDIAERNPSKVVDMFNSDEYKLKSVIYRAVSAGKIKISKDGKVTWGGTNTTLVTFNPSHDSVNAIVNYLNTKEGEEARLQLIKDVEGDN